MLHPKEAVDLTVERLEPGTKAWNENITAHKARYEFAHDIVRNKSVVDIACGVGYGSALLAISAARVIGIDINQEAVAYAQQHFANSNVTFAVGDAYRLSTSVPKSDVVVSFETVEHLPDPERFLSEIGKVIGREGTFIISVPNGKFDRYSNNQHHLHFFSPDDFVALLSTHFSSVRVWGQHFDMGVAGASIGFSTRHVLRRIIPGIVWFGLRGVLKGSGLVRAHTRFVENELEEAGVLVGVCAGYRA